jgi:hypothetical protein
MAITLQITPYRFIASSGKLDSIRRYIRKVSTGQDLKFVISQNMDVKNGGLRYVKPSGTAQDDNSYNGSFSGSAAVGIKV